MFTLNGFVGGGVRKMSEFWEMSTNLQISFGITLIVVLLTYIAFKVSDRSSKPRHHK